MITKEQIDECTNILQGVRAVCGAMLHKLECARHTGIMREAMSTMEMDARYFLTRLEVEAAHSHERLL